MDWMCRCLSVIGKPPNLIQSAAQACLIIILPHSIGPRWDILSHSHHGELARFRFEKDELDQKPGTLLFTPRLACLNRDVHPPGYIETQREDLAFFFNEGNPGCHKPTMAGTSKNNAPDKPFKWW